MQRLCPVTPCAVDQFPSPDSYFSEKGHVRLLILFLGNGIEEQKVSPEFCKPLRSQRDHKFNLSPKQLSFGAGSPTDAHFQLGKSNHSLASVGLPAPNESCLGLRLNLWSLWLRRGLQNSGETFCSSMLFPREQD